MESKAGAPMSAGAVRRDEQNHCKDCCCARSWEAIGVTTYTGMSIVEHIEQLVTQRDALHAQAVALAKALMKIDHALFPCASNRDLLDGGAEECNCIRQQAKALKEGR
jgi:hypothetical protein